MCFQCGDGGCAYCDGFLTESETFRSIQPQKRSMKEIKQLRNEPDYESLQLTKQSMH